MNVCFIFIALSGFYCAINCEHIPPSSHTATAAAADYMSSTVDLSGIEVVDADRRFIRQARKDVELQAHKMLEQGIEAQV